MGATCRPLIPLQRADERGRVCEQLQVVQHLRYAVVREHGGLPDTSTALEEMM